MQSVKSLYGRLRRLWLPAVKSLYGHLRRLCLQSRKSLHGCLRRLCLKSRKSLVGTLRRLCFVGLAKFCLTAKGAMIYAKGAKRSFAVKYYPQITQIGDGLHGLWAVMASPHASPSLRTQWSNPVLMLLFSGLLRCARNDEATHNPSHLLRGDVARYVSTCNAQFSLLPGWDSTCADHREYMLLKNHKNHSSDSSPAISEPPLRGQGGNFFASWLLSVSTQSKKSLNNICIHIVCYSKKACTFAPWNENMTEWDIPSVYSWTFDRENRVSLCRLLYDINWNCFWYD